MAKLTTLKDKQGNTLYPLTKTNTVSDSNGTSLDSLLSAINQNINTAQSSADNALNDTSSKLITTKYSKFFTHNTYRYGGRVYQKICTWSPPFGNKNLGMIIYTHTGYGEGDNNACMCKVAFEALNDQKISGFANVEGNVLQVPVFYAVKTANDYEWDIYWYCPQWSSAIMNITTTDDSGLVLAESDNFTESEPLHQLKIEPTSNIKVLEVIGQIPAPPYGVQLTASIPSGYKFLCWLQPATTGWIGSVYSEFQYNSTTYFYNASKDNVSGNIRCAYLVVRDI